MKLHSGRRDGALKGKRSCSSGGVDVNSATSCVL